MADRWAQAPPPPARPGRAGKYDWDDIVERLQQRPDEWLLVDANAKRGIESAIRRRKMTALQDPGWTYKTSLRNINRDEGTAELWLSAVKREDT